MAILAKPAQNLDPEPSAPPEELLSKDTACAKGPEHGEEATTPLTITVDIEVQSHEQLSSQRREQLLKRREELVKEIEDISRQNKNDKCQEIIVVTIFITIIIVVIMYVMFGRTSGSKSYSKDHKGEYNNYDEFLYKTRDRNYDIPTLPEGVYYNNDHSLQETLHNMQKIQEELEKYNNDKN